jgi:transcriptional regulator with XRE-family HTH domain
MDQRIISYLRPLRRRWGLTQKELAYLIGAKSAGVISRIEGLRRVPSSAAALACEIIFDTPPIELFPEHFLALHQGILDRVNNLYEELQGNPSKVIRAKLDFLEEVMARAHTRSSSQPTV